MKISARQTPKEFTGKIFYKTGVSSGLNPPLLHPPM
jgi:hypothetical protein